MCEDEKKVAYDAFQLEDDSVLVFLVSRDIPPLSGRGVCRVRPDGRDLVVDLGNGVIVLPNLPDFVFDYLCREGKMAMAQPLDDSPDALPEGYEALYPETTETNAVVWEAVLDAK